MVADHVYVFSITGQCVRCGKMKEAHPQFRPDGPDPMTECPIDHNSIQPARLIGDGGWEWRRCPFCHHQVEPKAATGVVTGYKYGPGRNDLTASMKKHLVGWLGWWKFNGGDDVRPLDD